MHIEDLVGRPHRGPDLLEGQERVLQVRPARIARGEVALKRRVEHVQRTVDHDVVKNLLRHAHAHRGPLVPVDGPAAAQVRHDAAPALGLERACA